MMWKLMREQWRAQRRITVGLLVMVTLAVALSSTAVVIASTQAAINRTGDTLYFHNYDNRADIMAYTAGIPTSESEEGGWASMELAEIEAILASGEAADMAVQFTHWGVVASTDGVQLGAGLVQSYYPQLPVFDLMALGYEPGPGEIAVSAQLAHDSSIEIGDTVTLRGDRNGTPDLPLTVSGLIASQPTFMFSSWPPLAVVAWEDSVAVSELYQPWAHVNSANEPTARVQLLMAWNGSVASLTPQTQWDWPDSSLEFPGAALLGAPSMHFSGALERMLWFAGVLVLGTLGASLALGRAQAQVRTQWTATARVLGATTRSMAAASWLEVLLLGLLASLIGVGLGHAAAQAGLIAAHLSAVQPFLPVAVASSWQIITALTIGGVLITGVIAAVPAFWARKVAPVAALKPVTPVMDEQASRTVSPRWLLGIAGLVSTIGLWAWAVSERTTSVHWTSLVAELAWFIMIPVSIMALIEVLRWVLPRMHSIIGKGRAPWAVAAHSALTAHPRMSTFPAAIMALSVAGVSSYAVASAVSGPTSSVLGWSERPVLESFTSWFGRTLIDLGVLQLIVAGFAIAGLLAFVVSAAARRTVRTDVDVFHALGLNKAECRRALAVHQAAPMLTGVAVGALAGWLAPLLSIVLAMNLSPHYDLYTVDYYAEASLYGAAGVLMITGIAALISVAAGAIAGAVAVTSAGGGVTTVRRERDFTTIGAP